MSTVDSSVVVDGICYRSDIMDIRIFLYGNLHETVRSSDDILLGSIGLHIEVSRFTIYGRHEDQRLARMRRAQLLYEREKTLTDLL